MVISDIRLPRSAHCCWPQPFRGDHRCASLMRNTGVAMRLSDAVLLYTAEGHLYTWGCSRDGRLGHEGVIIDIPNGDVMRTVAMPVRYPRMVKQLESRIVSAVSCSANSTFAIAGECAANAMLARLGSACLPLTQGTLRRRFGEHSSRQRPAAGGFAVAVRVRVQRRAWVERRG